MAGDITSGCNLRCPFCVVDYCRVGTVELMSKETFRRAAALMSAVPDAGFWLSCLHEPTLHPQLEAFLGIIPEDLRRKISFTTNLSRRIG